MNISIIALSVGFTTGFLLAMFYAIYVTEPKARDQVRVKAIEYNCAEYDSKTGKFQWILNE